VPALLLLLATRSSAVAPDRGAAPPAEHRCWGSASPNSADPLERCPSRFVVQPYGDRDGLISARDSVVGRSARLARSIDSAVREGRVRPVALLVDTQASNRSVAESRLRSRACRWARSFGRAAFHIPLGHKRGPRSQARMRLFIGTARLNPARIVVRGIEAMVHDMTSCVLSCTRECSAWGNKRSRSRANVRGLCPSLPRGQPATSPTARAARRHHP